MVVATVTTILVFSDPRLAPVAILAGVLVVLLVILQGRRPPHT